MNEDMMATLRAAQNLGLIIGIFLQILVGGSFRNQILINNPHTGDVVEFKETVSASHWLGGLVGTAEVDLNKICSRYESNSNIIVDAKVTTKITFIDSLCAIFTIFIYTPNTVEIEGHYQHAR